MVSGRSPRRCGMVLVFVLVATALAGCGTRSVPLATTTPFLLAQESDPTALRAAIVRALDARQYATESEADGRIVARFSQRGRMLRLAIDYSSRDYRVTYLDSAGFGYQVGPDGQPVISAHYDRQVRALQQTIESEIDRPAREAREAVEQQRQHELAVLEAERRRQAEAQQAQSNEAERRRQAELERKRLATERERLRMERAQAEAEARRPRIVAHDPVYVDGMAYRRGSRARFGSARVAPGFREEWLRGQAEGRSDAAGLRLPTSCRGYYDGTPEHAVVVRNNLDYLRIETDADQDVTIVGIAPDGNVYCDDDGGAGLNARIEGYFPAGTYRVMVGTYQPGASSRYELLLSETQAPSENAPPVAAAPVGPPDCRALVIQQGHAPAHAVHCGGAEPYCAAALLQAGHHPAHLVHCQGVDATCAQATLRAGHHPAHLVHCR